VAGEEFRVRDRPGPVASSSMHDDYRRTVGRRLLALAVSDEIFLKLLGVGMATAIFLDATVVRMVLVPALMQIFGRANWWIPNWLERKLPRLKPAPVPDEA